MKPTIKIKIIFATLMVLLGSLKVQANQSVVYPQAGQSFDKHHAYPLSLLKLALSKIEHNYVLQSSDAFMTQGRALKQLGKENGVDIMWTMTSRERESNNYPIRIPIYKGLIGWRVFLTNQQSPHNPKEPIQLHELKTLNVIQGHDWPDTKILQRNGFNVHSSPSFEGIFKMLNLGRADLFPRSIIEVWDELEIRSGSNISLEEHTIISYPTASYFFTARKNSQLAKLITRGLTIAIKDGSFDKLFNQYFSNVIAKARVSERKHYQLHNPLLSDETPLDVEKLWFLPN